jgi:hypothetical protein
MRTIEGKAAAVLVALASVIAPSSAIGNSAYPSAEAPGAFAEAEAARAAAVRARGRAEAARRRAEAAAVRARREAQRNSRERAAAERAAAQARAQAESEAQAARQAGDRADRLGRAAAAAEAAAKAERERAGEAQSRLWMIGGASAALILLLVGGTLLMRRRMKRRSAAEMDKLRMSRPDPVTAGVLRSAKLNLQLPGDKLPERAGGVVVGRNPELATAVISRNDVSRRHARFFHRDGQYWLEDLGSAGGSWVNDERIEEGRAVAVAPGDEVRFADYAFVFQLAR